MGLQSCCSRKLVHGITAVTQALRWTSASVTCRFAQMGHEFVGQNTLTGSHTHKEASVKKIRARAQAVVAAGRRHMAGAAVPRCSCEAGAARAVGWSRTLARGPLHEGSGRVRYKAGQEGCH